MSRKVLGIDIRKESVSAVLVTTSLRENRIDAHAHIPLPDAAEDDNRFKTALSALCNEIDPGGCDCVVSISADHFSYRILRIPFRDSKKIRMVLPFELEPTVPYPIDDLVVDFIDLQSAGPGDHSEIIAVAVPRTELNPYMQSLAEFKIDPEMVTVSGLPAAMCLANQADQGEDRLILEIGEASSSLFFVSAGRLQLIRSFPTPVVADNRAGMLGAFVQRTLAAYDELCQTEFQPLDIVVTGSGLNGAGLDDDVSSVLDIPVKRLNFAERLNVQLDNQNSKPWDPALMDNALALTYMAIEGIRGLNFHKGQFAAKKIFIKHKKNWIKTGILAAAVLALIFFSAITETYTLNRKLDHIDQQITGIFKATFPDVKRIVDPYREMQVNVQQAQKDAVVQAATGPHIRSIDILNSISRSIPDSIKVDVTRMVISPDTVLISGNTDDFKSVDDIKGKLEQIDYFKKVTISSTNLDRSGKEVRFQLKVEL
jgi:Tfp pilus assembly PilM family ATPase/Tfp pilus assembly protein PilN